MLPDQLACWAPALHIYVFPLLNICTQALTPSPSEGETLMHFVRPSALKHTDHSGSFPHSKHAQSLTPVCSAVLSASLHFFMLTSVSKINIQKYAVRLSVTLIKTKPTGSALRVQDNHCYGRNYMQIKAENTASK